MKLSRRQFLKSSLAASALVGAGGMGTLLTPRPAHAAANSPTLQKWIQAMRQLDILSRPLVDNANPIPTLSSVADSGFPGAQFYQVTAGEFTDQLHPALGPTRLWGYSDTSTGVQRHLGGVIVATRGVAARIRFTNTLPTPHIIPVDITLPGANQAQNRMAIHIHGGFVPWISDGGPFDWWAPNGTHGLSFLNGPGSVLDNIAGNPILPGQADYYYPNNQSTRLIWYHDHAHGITRLNAYAGLASGYLILDAVNAGYYAPATGFPNGKIPPLASTFPLVFQDKVFVNPGTTSLTDSTWSTVARPDVQSLGSLWYEHVYDPKVFRLLKSTKNLTPPNPSCIPEFFGDTMLANGLVYPTVTVEAKRYRFFILNACNARFLNINLMGVAPAAGEVTTDPKTSFAVVGTPVGPPIIQIGNEGGFLVTEATFPNGVPFNPATLTGNLLLAPAERADVIIDFTGKAGQEFMMYNDAPGPFPAGPPTTDYYLGNPKNPIQPLPGTGPDTRNILRIKVVAGASDPQPAGAILDPTLIDPPLLVPYISTVAPIPPLSAPLGTPVRDLTLNEDFDQYGRLRQLLGTTSPALVGKGFGLDYLAPTTENVAAGATEVWRIFNLSADTHPIHFHLVNVQVLSRQPFKVTKGVFAPTGVARGPEPNEVGWKETVQMHPGDVTTVIMKFDLPVVPFTVPVSPRTGGNEYVWHCHILEHEEHDMMRPLVVV
ncbi:MAG: multicopper oxidase domain-containing protein [Deltaproteobacteria bacterium]|nr:multicopper oxidase domain-containing protein [Deltaproteobacteria bacterium]